MIFSSKNILFYSNKLLSDKQPGFRPGGSAINQLFSITHEIYNAFEYHHDTRAVFLNISKAFDKVWHDGLLLSLDLMDLVVHC